MRWFTVKKKACCHDKNVRHEKYHLSDGTPMIKTKCLDCGYIDEGHVYADSENWMDGVVIRKNGMTEGGEG